MLVSLDLPEWVIDAIGQGPSPSADSGSSVESRIATICESWAQTVLGWEADDKQKALYRTFGIHRDDDRDDSFGL